MAESTWQNPSGRIHLAESSWQNPLGRIYLAESAESTWQKPPAESTGNPLAECTWQGRISVGVSSSHPSLQKRVSLASAVELAVCVPVTEFQLMHSRLLSYCDKLTSTARTFGVFSANCNRSWSCCVHITGPHSVCRTGCQPQPNVR